MPGKSPYRAYKTWLFATRHCVLSSPGLECLLDYIAPLTRATERGSLGVNTPPLTKKVEPAKKPDFELSLARLEEVVRKLESPQLSLDDAMKLFEEGESASRNVEI